MVASANDASQIGGVRTQHIPDTYNDFSICTLHDIIKYPRICDVRRVEKAFEVIEHTADIGIVAYGVDIDQVFSNAALGLFNLITDLDAIKENVQRDLELSSQDNENLLVEWLNELLYMFDVEHIVFKRFEVDKLDDCQLKARCFGEKINLQRDKIKREIKAATYHMLAIVKEDNIYKAKVIFDI